MANGTTENTNGLLLSFSLQQLHRQLSLQLSKLQPHRSKCRSIIQPSLRLHYKDRPSTNFFKALFDKGINIPICNNRLALNIYCIAYRSPDFSSWFPQHLQYLFKFHNTST
ncbi:UNVERIFIED_CONTAM: hypothetical protein FKN15_069402 [Acipenser sinensis]